jgi:hypothetical protein
MDIYKCPKSETQKNFPSKNFNILNNKLKFLLKEIKYNKLKFLLKEIKYNKLKFLLKADYLFLFTNSSSSLISI